MKAATISELKKELKQQPAPELMEIVLKLARFKKDNKELLTYLLYESNNEQAYIDSIKDEMEWEFEEINTDSVYYAKKSLRKILRNLKKQIRYSDHKRTEVELLLHFCKLLKGFSIPYHDYTTLLNMYEGQLRMARKAIEKLHEDLQYDYNEQIRMM
jgi:hypothetical protein